MSDGEYPRDERPFCLCPTLLDSFHHPDQSLLDDIFNSVPGIRPISRSAEQKRVNRSIQVSEKTIESVVVSILCRLQETREGIRTELCCHVPSGASFPRSGELHSER
jgi:hypothetical protein